MVTSIVVWYVGGYRLLKQLGMNTIIHRRLTSIPGVMLNIDRRRCHLAIQVEVKLEMGGGGGWRVVMSRCITKRYFGSLHLSMHIGLASRPPFGNRSSNCSQINQALRLEST